MVYTVYAKHDVDDETAEVIKAALTDLWTAEAMRERVPRYDHRESNRIILDGTGATLRRAVTVGEG